MSRKIPKLKSRCKSCRKEVPAHHEVCSNCLSNLYKPLDVRWV